MTSTGSDSAAAPVVFAYDGSELAGFAIEQAATQLATPRAAVVACVWQPADVGFTPIDGRHFDADRADEVEQAAEETAAHGAALAEKAGFTARAVTVKSAPTWKGIIQTAEDEHASLIVVGTHRHTGLLGHLAGSVAAAIVSHASVSVLLVHQPPVAGS
jgi:nucleotide-binding universal stress UspA family protein